MAVKSKEELLNSIREVIGEDSSDASLNLIEDFSDTYADLEEKAKIDYKEKYEEMRTRYKERFFQSEAKEDKNDDLPDEEDFSEVPQVKKFEDLFKTN